MKLFGLISQRIVVSTFCVLLFGLTVLPVHAEKRSNGFAITLLVSGLGFQVGSTLLNTASENQYEDYLSATVQADIQNYKDGAVARENASIIMSRVGYGCIGLAVLLHLMNQFHNATIETAPTPDIPGNTALNRQTLFSLTCSPKYLCNDYYGNSKMFSFRPSYDFQKQRAALQFTHRF